MGWLEKWAGDHKAKINSFRQNCSPPDNKFQLDYILEAADLRVAIHNSPNDKFSIFTSISNVRRQRSVSFSLAKVVGKQGSRICLRHLGTDDRNDIWLMVDSDMIRPYPSGYELSVPLGFMNCHSAWGKIIKRVNTEKKIAPIEWFPSHPVDPLSNRFKVGEKLEAIDRRNAQLICPATISEINGEFVLVSFDGWSGTFDYWAKYNSQDLFPVGWCSKAKHKLQQPGPYYGKSCHNISESKEEYSVITKCQRLNQRRRTIPITTKETTKQLFERSLNLPEDKSVEFTADFDSDDTHFCVSDRPTKRKRLKFSYKSDIGSNPFKSAHEKTTFDEFEDRKSPKMKEVTISSVVEDKTEYYNKTMSEKEEPEDNNNNVRTRQFSEECDTSISKFLDQSTIDYKLSPDTDKKPFRLKNMDATKSCMLSPYVSDKKNVMGKRRDKSGAEKRKLKRIRDLQLEKLSGSINSFVRVEQRSQIHSQSSFISQSNEVECYKIESRLNFSSQLDNGYDAINLGKQINLSKISDNKLEPKPFLLLQPDVAIIKKRKKSGAQNRKLKQAKDLQLRKISGSIDKFVKKDHNELLHRQSSCSSHVEDEEYELEHQSDCSSLLDKQLLTSESNNCKDKELLTSKSNAYEDKEFLMTESINSNEEMKCAINSEERINQIKISDNKTTKESLSSFRIDVTSLKKQNSGAQNRKIRWNKFIELQKLSKSLNSSLKNENKEPSCCLSACSNRNEKETNGKEELMNISGNKIELDLFESFQNETDKGAMYANLLKSTRKAFPLINRQEQMNECNRQWNKIKNSNCSYALVMCELDNKITDNKARLTLLWNRAKTEPVSCSDHLTDTAIISTSKELPLTSSEKRLMLETDGVRTPGLLSTSNHDLVTAECIVHSEKSGETVTDPNHWTIDDVQRYLLHKCPSLESVATEFKNHEIDGPALLLMTMSTLRQYMKIKLGPAIKIESIVKDLLDGKL